jgi:hypothetical protein
MYGEWVLYGNVPDNACSQGQELSVLWVPVVPARSPMPRDWPLPARPARFYAPLPHMSLHCLDTSSSIYGYRERENLWRDRREIVSHTERDTQREDL